MADKKDPSQQISRGPRIRNPRAWDLLGSSWTNEKADVTACLGEASSKIAANCSNAED